MRVRLHHSLKVSVRMGYEFQAAPGGDGRVLLPERAGSGVPGINEGLLAGGERIFADKFKILFIHIDLAARFKKRRGVAQVQLNRHGPDRAHVKSNVLAGLPVAAGGGPGQAPFFVLYRAGKAVYLGFHYHFKRFFLKALLYAPIPLQKLFGGVAVIQGKHGDAVRNRGECVRPLAAYAAGWRIVGS